jgi:di/tricarboxylate transporter
MLAGKLVRSAGLNGLASDIFLVDVTCAESSTNIQQPSTTNSQSYSQQLSTSIQPSTNIQQPTFLRRPSLLQDDKPNELDGLQLNANDLLHFIGSLASLTTVLFRTDTSLMTVHGNDAAELDTSFAKRRLALAVISPESSLVGLSLASSDFSHQYGAAVVGVQRHGKPILANLVEEPLASGDTLLLETTAKFAKKYSQHTDFSAISTPDGNADSTVVRERPFHAAVAAVVVVFVVTVVSLGLTDMSSACAVGVFTLLISRVLTQKQALSALNGRMFIVTGTGIGLAVAMEQSKAAAALASIMTHTFGGGSELFALFGVAASTGLLTQVLPASATAALMHPIVMKMGYATDGAGHTGRLLAVLIIAANSKFCLPYSNGGNILTHEIGGYDVSDWLRFGIPVWLVVISLSAPVVLVTIPDDEHWPTGCQ